ncbi:MAG TPA: adenylate kinase [Candidatus Methanomethylicus sp.]|nr:adenylate kinase [Candidatus Methanomethylicus sp.]
MIVTGIPGVGKTTVLTAALAACNARSVNVDLVNYGNMMFEEASKKGLVKTRDEMRRLGVKTQVQLQLAAAKAIARIAAKGNVLLDTHMFINTPIGFMPGIPSWVGESLKPDSIALLEADPAEVSKRRQKDAAIRAREADSPERISEHQLLGRSGAAALAVQTGCTVVIAHNREGAAEAAAKVIADLFM